MLYLINEVDQDCRIEYGYVIRWRTHLAKCIYTYQEMCFRNTCTYNGMK